MALVTLFNQNMGEVIKAPILVEEASWIESKAGRLVFTLPITHEFAKYQYLKWGTVITAEFDWFNRIWVGFVDPPRKWPNGSILVNARSMEHIFHYRRQRGVAAGGKVSTPLVLKGSSGSIIKQILDIANSKQHTRVYPGSIYMGGIERQETVNELLDMHIRGVSSRSGGIWEVVGTINNGVLSLLLNYRLKQDFYTTYTLEEGINLETGLGHLLVEDGEVINDVLGLGEGETEELVNAAIAQDGPSIAAFGLRQGIEVFPGNVEVPTIQANANEFIAEHRDAFKALNPVLPYTQEVISQLQLGAWMPLVMHSVGFKSDGTIGFNGYASTRSITINEQTRQVSLVVGEESEDLY